MKLLLLLLAATTTLPRSIDGLPIGALPRQTLPAQGCAAYLFTVGATRALAAVATAQAGQLRLALDGRVVDLSREAGGPAGAFGFAPATTYRGDVTAVLELAVAERRELAKGALVPTATLRIDRNGGDSVVIPMAGMIGCA